MEKYLGPLCDILAHNFKDHEFQILVRLKDRSTFESFYLEKIKEIEGQLQIPESTYIFSQAMANLQVSLVKKFNLLYNRSGTLMSGRYKREHITAPEGVVELIKSLNDSQIKKRYSGIWAECAMNRIKAMSSKGLYKSLINEFDSEEEKFWETLKEDLVDKFNFEPKEDQFFKFNFLQRRLFNSICKHFS